MATLATMLTNLVTKLDAKNWPGGSNPVFGSNSVIVSSGMPEHAFRTLRVPAAIIIPQNGQADPEFGEEPDYLLVDVTIRIITQHYGDAVGEAVIMGGHKSGGASDTKGRGLLEIEEQVHDVIGKLTTADSINIQHTRSGEVTPVFLDDKTWWAYRDLKFKAVVTAT